MIRLFLLFRQAIGVRNLHLALLEPKRLPLLGSRVLDPRLLHVRPLEPPQEMGIPELRADAEVLAAAHQGVGLAPLDRGGQLVGREVGVFPLGLRDEPVGWVSAKILFPLLFT